MDIRISICPFHGGANFTRHAIVNSVQAVGARKRDVSLAVARFITKSLEVSHP
ncbi:Uncharacterised protein [Mycobacterium tuberculosis]|nr:Uncharacterised protein [Mycobacterium tuberculosis]